MHERDPRKSGKGGDKDSNEIQGISGSTRLEAKRQRRRDGRDAGRRRPPILSEAEFLARREAVERVMVVRDKVRTEPPHEGARYTQIAVLEDGVVVEHFVTSAASASLVGNIYLGIVQNVLPSMEAAFVDIGRGRNGVLYAGEVNWEAAGLGGAQRKIEQALKPGDYVVVQVSKDPVGHKGARLTTQVSLAGRYLVYVPGASSTGISRKLPDTERQRLKEILREVVPAEAGVIIRTASEGVKEEDIRTDVNRLQERWTQIEAKAVETKKKAAGAAIALYEEPDVLVKVIRDLFNEDFTGLIVSGDEAWDTINDYVNSVAPELVPRMNKYEAAGTGRPGRIRRAPHRRAADQGHGPQGVAAVRRHAGHRPHRGDDRGRREHRQVHRFRRQPGADRHQETTSRPPRRSCASCGCAISAASSSSTSSTWSSSPTATWCCAG